MLTRLRVRNFKRLKEVDIELGQAVVLIGPNNWRCGTLAYGDGMRNGPARRPQGKGPESPSTDET